MPLGAILIELKQVVSYRYLSHGDSMKIHDLTQIQAEMAEALWACDTTKDVDLFFQGLPAELKIEASAVLELMILSAIDEEVASMDHYPDAEEAIKKVAKKRK
jgi:hypothetical protein